MLSSFVPWFTIHHHLVWCLKFEHWVSYSANLKVYSTPAVKALSNNFLPNIWLFSVLFSYLCSPCTPNSKNRVHNYYLLSEFAGHEFEGFLNKSWALTVLKAITWKPHLILHLCFRIAHGFVDFSDCSFFLFLKISKQRTLNTQNVIAYFMWAVFYSKKHNAKEDQNSIFIKSLGSMQVILSHEKVQRCEIFGFILLLFPQNERKIY